MKKRSRMCIPWKIESIMAKGRNSLVVVLIIALFLHFTLLSYHTALHLTHLKGY